MCCAAARTVVAARLLECRRAIRPDLVDTRGEQAQAVRTAAGIGGLGTPRRSKATQVRRGMSSAARRPTTFACFSESTIFCGRKENAVRRMLKNPTEQAQSVRVSPFVTNRTRCPSLAAIMSARSPWPRQKASTRRSRPSNAPLSTSVKSPCSAPPDEPFHHVENAHPRFSRIVAEMRSGAPGPFDRRDTPAMGSPRCPPPRTGSRRFADQMHLPAGVGANSSLDSSGTSILRRNTAAVAGRGQGRLRLVDGPHDGNRREQKR